MALHSNEVMRLCHGSAAFGEIFFEKFAEEFPFAPAEQWAGLDRQLEPPFVQARIGGFVQILVVSILC